jgi:hypothetical protein
MYQLLQHPSSGYRPGTGGINSTGNNPNSSNQSSSTNNSEWGIDTRTFNVYAPIALSSLPYSTPAPLPLVPLPSYIPIDHIRSEYTSRAQRRHLHSSNLSYTRNDVLQLPHPIWQDPTLDQHSKNQYRIKAQNGIIFTHYLHPPVRNKPNRSSSASAINRTPLKRYHTCTPVTKPPLPSLNKATYAKYLAETQPLRHPTIAGRKMCKVSQWKEALLQRKIDPYNGDIHS